MEFFLQLHQDADYTRTIINNNNLLPSWVRDKSVKIYTCS